MAVKPWMWVQSMALFNVVFRQQDAWKDVVLFNDGRQACATISPALPENRPEVRLI
jgi:hypothetical protein